MADHDALARMEAATRAAARDYTRFGAAWFGFAQVLYLATYGLTGGTDGTDSEDLALIDIAAGIGGLAALLLVVVLVIGLRADRAGDVPSQVRERRLADLQAAWIALALVVLGQLVVAVLAVLTFG